MSLKTNDCRMCGKRFTYQHNGVTGRYRVHCDDCRPIAKREDATRRKRAQRARQKENGAGVKDTRPASVWSDQNNTSFDLSQPPRQKMEGGRSPAPLLFGRGSGQRPEYDLDWADIIRRVDRMMGPFGFLFL